MSTTGWTLVSLFGGAFVSLIVICVLWLCVAALCMFGRMVAFVLGDRKRDRELWEPWPSYSAVTDDDEWEPFPE